MTLRRQRAWSTPALWRVMGSQRSNLQYPQHGMHCSLQKLTWGSCKISDKARMLTHTSFYKTGHSVQRTLLLMSCTWKWQARESWNGISTTNHVKQSKRAVKEGNAFSRLPTERHLRAFILLPWEPASQVFRRRLSTLLFAAVGAYLVLRNYHQLQQAPKCHIVRKWSPNWS